MPSSLTCPHCRATLAMPDGPPLSAGRCPKCGRTFSTGQATADRGQPAVQPVERSSSEPALEPAPEDNPFARKLLPPSRLPPIATLWQILKWFTLTAGGILCLLAFTVNAIQAAALAGLACFLGITSRIMQAEEHASRQRRQE